MLTFYGTEIELFVEQVLTRDEGLSICCARDWMARRWLIVRVDDDPDNLAWLCVPISDRTMAAVLGGYATPRDAVQRSSTGTVELVVVDHGRAVPDRCLPWVDLPQQLLPADEGRLLPAA
jgi:hypothetical protein